jgi:hypothetical protein
MHVTWKFTCERKANDSDMIMTTLTVGMEGVEHKLYIISSPLLPSMVIQKRKINWDGTVG